MSVAIIDYGSGNLRSAEKAFERAARECGYKGKVAVTSDPDAVRRADRIVLPGVGAFGDCRAGLRAVPGMWDTVEEVAGRMARPFLGICVGMQLMAERGREHGIHEGFGWIAGDVDMIRPSDPALKVPHMGWNTLRPDRTHAVFEGIPLGPDGLHAYFVHSYQLQPANRADCVACAEYGGRITAAVGRDNMVGTQFHPEKSQVLGLRLIANFLAWAP